MAPALLGVGAGDIQVAFWGGLNDSGAHLHQSLLVLEPLGVGGQTNAVPFPCKLHTASSHHSNSGTASTGKTLGLPPQRPNL